MKTMWVVVVVVVTCGTQSNMTSHHKMPHQPTSSPIMCHSHHTMPHQPTSSPIMCHSHHTMPHQPTSSPIMCHSRHARHDPSPQPHHHARDNRLTRDPQRDDLMGSKPLLNDRLTNKDQGISLPGYDVQGSHHSVHHVSKDDDPRIRSLEWDDDQKYMDGHTTRAFTAASLSIASVPTIHSAHFDNFLGETSSLPDHQRPRRDIPRDRTLAEVLRRSSEAPTGARLSAGEPPAEEVVAMISDTVTQHLADCHKVVLYMPEAPYKDLAGLVASGLGEAAFVWQLDALLARPPPRHTILRRTHHRAATSLCVAFIVLADLQSAGVARVGVQRGPWFAGASKLLLVYTTDDLQPHTLASHPLLGSGHDTALVSCWSWTEKTLPRLDQPTHITQKNLHDSSRVYRVISTCPYCRGGGQGVRLVDEWKPGQGFLRANPLYPDTFQNFQGHTFNIVTLEYAPFTCYERTDGVEVRLLDCVDTRMLDAIATFLNFTYRVREPADHQWGYRLDNGSYTGVIGAVQRYEADFSLNVAFTGDREKVIDYTVGYFNDPLTFCTTKPRLLNQVFALVRPFQPTVWVGFVMVLMVMGPLYYLTCLTTSKLRQLPQPPSLSKVLLDIYGACFSQSRVWWRGDGSRVLVASWIIFSLVSLTYYVAMLTASFTLPTLSPTLNTLQELVESDFSWGIQDQGAADYQLLKSSRVPLYQEVYRGLEVCPSLDECLLRARDTNYAFITWRLYMEDRIAIKFTSGAGERQLHVATSDFFPSDIGWAMNPGCPFRHKFNHVMRRLLEAGLVTRWLSQIIHDPARRQSTDTHHLLPPDGPRPLGLDHLQGIFYILVVGSIVAALFFTAEVWTVLW